MVHLDNWLLFFVFIVIFVVTLHETIMDFRVLDLHLYNRAFICLFPAFSKMEMALELDSTMIWISELRVYHLHLKNISFKMNVL